MSVIPVVSISDFLSISTCPGKSDFFDFPISRLYRGGNQKSRIDSVNDHGWRLEMASLSVVRKCVEDKTRGGDVIMATKDRNILKTDVMGSVWKIAAPFSVADLVAELPLGTEGRASRSNLDRALAELCADGALTMVRRYPVRRYVIGRPHLGAIADPAPDWGPCYPSGGEQIGPTWQALWEAMASGEWFDVRELLATGEAVRGCAELTVRNLLYAAAKARHIEPEARLDEVTHRWRMWYRRPDRVADQREVGV